MVDTDIVECASRIIVALDPDPDSVKHVINSHKDYLRKWAFTFLDKIAGTGVIIKVNSLLRLLGYGFITELHDRGLKVFADLKFNDIPHTLETDAVILAHYKPDMVTVMCSVGIDGMRSMNHLSKKHGGQCEVLGVTVLTSLDEPDTELIYGKSLAATLRQQIADCQLCNAIDGLIMSARDIALVPKKQRVGLTINTPGIRSLSMQNGDQLRIATPADAIRAGADRIIAGRLFTNSDNPRDCISQCLYQINEALITRQEEEEEE